MCGKFHTPLRMVHVLVAIFGGLVPNSKNIDRQSDEFLDTIYGWVCFFLQSKFSTSLLASLAGGLPTEGSLVNYRANKPYTLVVPTSIAWY